MTVLNNFLFLSDIEEPQESGALFNQGGDTLTLQVSGDASIVLTVQGQSDSNAPFVDLFGIAFGGAAEKISVIKDITANGIYAYDISGIIKLKVNATIVSGGKVTAFGKVTTE